MKRLTQLENGSGGTAVSGEPAIPAGKFRVPRTGPDVLQRERLTALIEQAAERPVTVITAPPGAGKTVACAGWAAARSRSRRIGWLTLDEGDRDPGRFWAGLTAALAAGGVGATGSPLVPRSRESAEDLPGDLVSAMRKLSGSQVLVIDDVHLLSGSDVLPGLALLIRHAPASLRFILCGRSVPRLQLARMRLGGTLSELRGADLACTADEAETYFAHLGLGLDAAGRAALLEQTEGWMAGPRLAALVAARDGELRADALATDPVVAEYLRDEVLDREPPHIRAFLRRTSIAGRVTPELAARVTEEAGSARILDRLYRANVLVERDGPDGYRYHPFLRQALLAELRCELPAEVPVLFSRAARWHAGRGEVIEAARCVAEAASADVACWDALPAVLAEAGLAGALSGRAAELEAVLGRVPAAYRSDPAVAAALAMARLYRGDPDAAGAYLSRADRSLVDSRPVVELWLATLRLLRQPDEAAVARGWPLAERAQAVAGSQPEHQAAGMLWLALGTVRLGRGEVTKAARALTAAGHQLTAAGSAGLAARAGGWLAVAAALAGDLGTAAELSARLLAGSAEGAEAPADGIAGPAVRGLALLAAAQVAIDRDDLVGAAQLLDDAAARAAVALPGEPDLALLVATARARVALAEGDVVRARDLARLARGRDGAQSPALTLLDFDAALRGGDLDLAAAALGPAPDVPVPDSAVPDRAVPDSTVVDSTVPDEPCQGEAPARAAARARLLLAAGEPAAALAQALGAAADGDGRSPPSRRDRVAALLTAVIAARRTSGDGRAAQLLEEALAVAEPHELYRPFLDAGGGVHSALALLVPPASPVAVFAGRVHERFVCQPSSRAAGGGPGNPRAGTLTASELAVLRLLRSYMSNQDIADTLFLSINTVKTHLRSVYFKLGVSSRREAVERGSRLRLL